MPLPGRAGSAAALLSIAVVAGAASPAAAVEVTCRNGDALGWSVSTDGDFNGDGITDIAAGAPCARANGFNRAGRAYVYSGATGERLLSLHGTEVDQQLGATITFIDDVDGDGRNDVAVGSPTFDSPKPGGGTFNSGGKVEVHSSKGGIAWTAYGTNAQAMFGESVDALTDVNGDTIGDVVVGASGANVDLGPDAGGIKRVGIAYVLSGADGSSITESRGTRTSDAWANVVTGVRDVDNDGNDDIAVSASSAEVFPDPGEGTGETTTTTLVETTTTLADTTTSTTSTTTTTTTTLRDAGIVQILSGVFPYDEIARYTGSDRQRLGRSVAGVPDLDGDQKDDLWLGAPGNATLGLADSGRITLVRSASTNLHISEPQPQASASFGTSLAVVGNLNGDGVPDIAAAAPTATTVSGGAQTGRVHAFSGTGVPSAPLWTREGPVGRARMGQSIDGGIFYDNDAIPDLVVGAPGDAPNGRRNAGSVYVLSGADGSTLERFGGRRGGETRIFVSGPSAERRPLIRAFDLRGRRREADIEAFRSQEQPLLSMDVLNDDISTGPDDMQLAVGTGPGGRSNTVAVYRAGRRRSRISLFSAGPSGYTGGINVAGGNLALDDGVEDLNDDVKDEIAVVPADASGGNVDVTIYRDTFTDELGRKIWSFADDFRVFSATDKHSGVSINAVGANIASGDVLTGDSKDELVVAPAAGLPVIRTFSRSGTQRASWLAFPATGTDLGPNSGVSIALGNLDGDANNVQEIVAAVADGQLWIRAFRGNGTPLPRSPGGEPVSILVFDYPPGYRGGLRVAAADVDFDDAAEILVAPASDIAGPILAFELDGSHVEGWKPFYPLGPGVETGINLISTDSFVRR